MGTKNNPGDFDCYANAEPDEPMFILLGRDPDGAMLVRLWADIREARGGRPGKIAQARAVAADMARWCEEKAGRIPTPDLFPPRPERQLQKAIQDGVREGVAKKFADSYGTVAKAVSEMITAEVEPIRELLSAAINSAVTDLDFRVEIMSAVRQAMAKQLVQKFGGELEKQVNALKSDPTTRARITLELEQIVTKGQEPPTGYVRADAVQAIAPDDRFEP